ncbi:S66 peptidase family protein [Streptomyces sp. TP-A0874]|uniref:S66 peptidase family protein n=1 Tax=Streptomyces sp. TP-A0874 TaxID=549819 RepID=UPI00099F7092|nr:S66 peptidase family protein [Streptomyces sp. TP-A0874]
MTESTTGQAPAPDPATPESPPLDAAAQERMFTTESSLAGSDASRAVVVRFLRTLLERGYRLTPAAPIVEADETVAFVNATVTPHKATLAANRSIGRICHYQPCFRAHGEHPWLFAFGMTGLLADVETDEDLRAVAVDSHLATLAALPDHRADRLHILVDSRDTEIIEAVAHAVDQHGGQLHVLDEPQVSTRWEYGEGYALRGRGITYYYRRPGVGCATECRPDCRCPRWQPLSNLILVESAERRYAEIGFGVEITAAIPFGPNPFALPEIAERVQAAESAGLAPEQAADLVNLYRALALLIENGARPAGKGPGSIVRKFCLRLMGLLAPLTPGQTEDLFEKFGASRGFRSALQAEGERRARSIAQNLKRAASVLDRHPDTTDADLRATYGLSPAQLSTLRQARSRPPRLEKGDAVTVVSPSWQGAAVFPERAARGIGEIAARAQLRVSQAPPAAGHEPGSRWARAEQFNAALRDPEVNGVLWMIGGLSAAELLDLIDYEAFAARPKVLCGYSDATVLHHALYARTKVTTFYGPAVLSQFAETGGTPEFTLQSFLDVTTRGWTGAFPRSAEVFDEFVDWGGDDRPRVPEAAPPRAVLRAGTGQGPLLAGCVPSVLQLLGTPWLPDYAGHVLALETSNDDGYGPVQAARDLWQMRHAGLLDGITGLVMGRPRMWTTEQRAELDRILLEVCHGLTFPIVTEFEFGHTDPMLTLPVGVPVELAGDELRLLEPAVR